ncbi:MAG TPA: glucose-1-phosphate adenylyltransferase [Thermoanaerobaculia bacterium]|jgi:glucose-1-phosphate adenylyltransferase|nr:glucose-1-phosphate adenylyltransferase [Thermoanaerobaculia bacterium]
MKTRAVILAGGEGSRLGVLTDKRAKPAVPFAGKYRIIDFTLSNCVNSGLFDVMILTQYRPHSLNEHIAAGRPWDLDRSFTGGVKIYQPYRGRLATDWYKGTADAVYQNLSFVQRGSPDLVLVLSGDHIYKMNYAEMIGFHASRRADVTIATLEVSREEATRMGILATDAEGRVTQFVEKPAEPPGTLASMGIYIFGAPLLSRVLNEDGRRRDSFHDFGKDVLPRLIQEGLRVFAYPFGGYWVDVGTIEAYWRTQMDLLRTPPPFDLNDRAWIVHTVSEEQPPVRIQAGATVEDSLVTDGCVIAPGARVEKSVLSPGVVVGPGAVVRESVVLSGAVIESGARIRRTIVDKFVRVGRHARIGAIGRAGEPPLLTTLGKNAVIPDHAIVPAGASAAADATAVEFVPAKERPPV